MTLVYSKIPRFRYMMDGFLFSPGVSLQNLAGNKSYPPSTGSADGYSTATVIATTGSNGAVGILIMGM